MYVCLDKTFSTFQFFFPCDKEFDYGSTRNALQSLISNTRNTSSSEMEQSTYPSAQNNNSIPSSLAAIIIVERSLRGAG